MKICIVGPGYMSIPPKGWVAVEILVDDYRQTLINMGHQVDVVNTRDTSLIVWLVNSLNPDFVHIQYEEYANLSKFINCKNVAITSHYAYLTQPHKWNPGYKDIFWNTVNSNSHIFALSEQIAEMYIKAGVSRTLVKVTPNGVRTDKYTFNEECTRPNESICLAKIETRKRQQVIQDIEGIKFVGNNSNLDFKMKDESYLGEWQKHDLYKNLTQFSNLVLLSDGEAHPLVCMEALSAGLGLVISEFSTANLDLNLPFIDVIPECKILDIRFIEDKIIKNREISIKLRSQIREYSKTLDWQNVINSYYINAVRDIVI